MTANVTTCAHCGLARKIMLVMAGWVGDRTAWALCSVCWRPERMAETSGTSSVPDDTKTQNRT